MLEIEIDGKQLQVSDGSTVMEAAATVGAYVPHFCYHKKLSIAANCRMCLVQVEKAPKPLPACATPVTNGMKVWTHSEQAVKAQKGVMEFLLINHPLDCPVCDQGGECQLQDLSVGYGGAQSRYEEEKRVVGNKNLGPLVSTDMTRCINCTRCVRFTTEIAGLMELGQAFRGEHAEIMPFVEKTVDSELSGNIIDLCPVGALTSKPFRFAARAWEMSRRKSISPHDSLGSNLIVQVKHDVVKRVLPLENEAVNECWLSDKDRFSYEGLNGEDRLKRPMVKQGGAWIETDWQTAMDYVVRGLKGIRADHGPESIGALGSPHSTLEELFLLQSVVRGLGSGNVDFRLRQSDFSADGRMKGAPWLGMSVSEIAGLDRLLIVGSFFRKDHPLVAQRVRQAVKKGLKVSAINPAFDDWQFALQNQLCVSPSEMSAALAKVLKALVEQGAQRCRPSSRLLLIAFRSTSRRWPLRVVSVPVVVWLSGWVTTRFSTRMVLPCMRSHPKSPGCPVAGSVCWVRRPTAWGYLAGAVPFGAVSGKNASEMLSTPLKAYVLLGIEPEFDLRDAVAARKAFGAAEMVVMLSAFKFEEALGYADVMLPVSPFTETGGAFVNCEGRTQSFHPVVKNAGDSRPAWKVLRVLGEALGLGNFDYESVDAVRAQILGASGSVDPFRLSNDIDIEPLNPAGVSQGLQRVADIPIHFADPLVRRSAPLQATKDSEAPFARISPATLKTLGLNAGDKVVVRSVSGSATVVVSEDEGVAAGCASGSGPFQHMGSR
jgi:NADH-quinone oxidoreductase subunit G